MKNCHSRCAGDIRNYTAKFDVGALKDCLNSIEFPRTLIYDFIAISYHFS